MDWQALWDYLATPGGKATAVSVLTVALSLIHMAGYQVPIFSALVNALIDKLKPAAAATNPPAPSGLVGGSSGPLPPSVLRAHPLFDMIRGLVSQQAGGLPANHPLIDQLALHALAASPGLLALFPATAPFAPIAVALSGLLHMAQPVPPKNLPAAA